jgi:hypothetical protein
VSLLVGKVENQTSCGAMDSRELKCLPSLREVQFAGCNVDPLIKDSIKRTYLDFIWVSVRAVVRTFETESSEVQNWTITFKHHPRLVI